MIKVLILWPALAVIMSVAVGSWLRATATISR